MSVTEATAEVSLFGISVRFESNADKEAVKGQAFLDEDRESRREMGINESEGERNEPSHQGKKDRDSRVE